MILLWIPASRLQKQEDLSQLIPNSGAMERIDRAMEGMKIRDKVVLNLYLADTSSTDPDLLTEFAELVADSLRKPSDSSIIAELRYKQEPTDFEQLFRFYTLHQAVFTDDAQFERLKRITHPDSLRALVQMHYQNLISPAGMVSGKFIESDPLGISTGAMKNLVSLQLDENVEWYDGYYLNLSHKNLLMFLNPAFRSSDNQKNTRLVNRLTEVRQAVKNESKGKVIMEFYGGPAVAVSNADRIKKDTYIVSILSVIGLLGLLLYYYRNVRSLVVLLLPVASGSLFALAVLFLLQGSISVIALAAGSVVLGIAINYSLHFLTHFKHSNHPETVIRELTKPMLLGCITTVSAFYSLCFLQSGALQDFGLFAGTTLIGTLLFCFILLPHILKQNKISTHKTNGFDTLANYKFHQNKWWVSGLIAGIVILSFFAGKAGFEQDMRHLSYESDSLRIWHNNLDKINHYTQQSVFVSVNGSKLNEVISRNDSIQDYLQQLKKKYPLIQISGLGEILISTGEQQRRIDRWNNFWTPETQQSIANQLQKAGEEYGFRPDAFSAYFNGLKNAPVVLQETDWIALNALLGNNYLQQGPEGYTLFSVIKTPEIAKKAIYNQWEQHPGTTVFDNARITGLFAEALAGDFQWILLTTGLLVFGFMLFSHGRIETTLINFLPMLVSWICILGIMGLLGIQFNLINIIISTFIFGLGDDYSIFILDGLSNEYKYGRKMMDSYKSSILLSAATALLGIGVLIFAAHPALKSIALVTVLGIVIVIVVSFVLQPLLYNFLILRRSRKGLPPYTLFNLGVTALGFLVFMAGSLLLSVFGLLLFYLTPFKKEHKRYVFHAGLMWVNRFMLACFVNVRKRIIRTGDFNFKKPAILVANHQSHIDLALIMQLHPKIIIFTNDWVWDFPFYRIIVRLADFYPASRGYEASVAFLRPLIDSGYSVMIFPEGTRSIDGRIQRFHKGAFYLQQELNLDIVPILIHGAGDCVTKGDFHFKKGSLTVKILPGIKPGQPHVMPYKEKAKWVCNLMREEYKLLRDSCETGTYFRSRLISNYIYKGPVLEWYTRVKTYMEGNYQIFNLYLPQKGRIVDIGCGYGYLSLMLSFIHPEREILALDYDADKIAIAQNCFATQQTRVSFQTADLLETEIPDADGIVALDVLHYLTPSQQVLTINRLMEKLRPDGVLIIRDANADMKSKHAGTRYTEFFSTTLGYNKKTKEGLHFVSSELILETVAKRGGFSCEIIDNTRFLSNLVYVIKPQSNRL